MKYYYLILLFFFIACNENNDDCCPVINLGQRDDLIIENDVFKISYNELKEQPNWIEYTVRDFVKVADRGNMDFYLVKNIKTSDDNDYYNNKWDKGHMAPAGSFTDSWSNLAKTFSFVNCALQVDNLNRGEWRELEEEVRSIARTNGPVKVRIELKFSNYSQVLETGATVPDGFYKFLTFSDNSKQCFYFENDNTNMNWTEYEINCN
ncbi:MAG: DNA/RNA non-specific endonuclease [Flavobacteriaceae bacterium]|nr:DNA/RNA non-specific endonuclease [Flavobacteriaceae bacterium]